MTPALDHRLLRLFLAVAEEGSMRRAAERLALSQPPLSQAIRQLEARLGVTLFERSRRGVRPTAAGEELAAEARGILARLERAEHRVRAAGRSRERLRLGFVSAALNGPLPTLLRTLKAERPALELTLREMTTPEQLACLADGRIDAGLLHSPVAGEPDLGLATLGRDPFWAALPDDHPLSQRAGISFAEIAGEPFVLFPEEQGPSLHGAIRRAAFDAGYDLRVSAEAARVHSQLALVAGGLGNGLVAQSAARTLRFAGVEAVPLSDTVDRLYMELVLAAAPPLLRELRAHLPT